MPYFTDIASEIYEKRKNKIPCGVQMEHFEEGCVGITEVNITREGLNRAKGKYITLDMPLLLSASGKNEEHITVLAKQLSRLLAQSGNVLVAGIGNNEVTADSLGPACVRRVLANQSESELMPRRVCAVLPGVEGASGISTREYLCAVIEKLRPDTVICIDSLLTKTPSRLGTSVQLSTSGLAPGTAKELSKNTLGVETIAAGIPTMMQLKTPDNTELVVTGKNIDFIVRRGSALLSAAVNKALYPALTLSEIDFITF